MMYNPFCMPSTVRCIVSSWLSCIPRNFFVMVSPILLGMISSTPCRMNLFANTRSTWIVSIWSVKRLGRVGSPCSEPVLITPPSIPTFSSYWTPTELKQISQTECDGSADLCTLYVCDRYVADQVYIPLFFS